jgi:hypothetical protein
MKYNRFSRRRKNYLFGLSGYYKSRKKSTKKQDYMVSTGRSEMLDSGFYENQVWGLSTKPGKDMRLPKNKREDDKMEHYARIVQELQHDLGPSISPFDDIGMPA